MYKPLFVTLAGKFEETRLGHPVLGTKLGDGYPPPPVFWTYEIYKPIGPLVRLHSYQKEDWFAHNAVL